MTHVNTDNASDVTLRKCLLGTLAVSQRKEATIIIILSHRLQLKNQHSSSLHLHHQVWVAGCKRTETRAAAPRHFTINYIYCITCQVCQYLCRWTTTWGRPHLPTWNTHEQSQNYSKSSENARQRAINAIILPATLRRAEHGESLRTEVSRERSSLAWTRVTSWFVVWPRAQEPVGLTHSETQSARSVMAHFESMKGGHLANNYLCQALRFVQSLKRNLLLNLHPPLPSLL